MKTVRKPLMIAITGADGSGKSTACARVVEILRARLGADARKDPAADHAVAEVSVWDCLQDANGIMPAFRTQQDAARYLGDLDGTSRTLFIFHALARAVQLGMRKNPKVLLLNGYWYKYAVSEIGYGVDADFVMGAAQGFAPPAHVFCLDIDPSTAWERRQRASEYEQGGGNVAGNSERDRFLGFQAKLRTAWEGIEAQSGLHWEHLSALALADEVANEIVAGILLRLEPRVGPDANASRGEIP